MPARPSCRRCRRCRCLHCNELYTPDSRNRGRQRFCSAAVCRRASKRTSQARWLAAPANRDYFRGPANSERNRRWRRSHPGYWKRSLSSRTQQDPSFAQDVDKQQLKPSLAGTPQQDPLSAQLPLVVGLIATLAGSPQQETIDRSLRRIHRLGTQALTQLPGGVLPLAMLPAAAHPPP